MTTPTKAVKVFAPLFARLRSKLVKAGPPEARSLQTKLTDKSKFTTQKALAVASAF